MRDYKAAHLAVSNLSSVNLTSCRHFVQQFFLLSTCAVKQLDLTQTKKKAMAKVHSAPDFPSLYCQEKPYRTISTPSSPKAKGEFRGCRQPHACSPPTALPEHSIESQLDSPVYSSLLHLQRCLVSTVPWFRFPEQRSSTITNITVLPTRGCFC